MTRHFVSLGMTTIGHVANAPLAALKSKIRARFGKQSDIQVEVSNVAPTGWMIALSHQEPLILLRSLLDMA